jgi:hypothetical protein
MHKLGVHHRAGLILYAIAHRLVQVPTFEETAQPGSAPKNTPSR